MSNIRIAAATSMTLAIALAGLGGPVAAGSPTTRYVDDDGMAGHSGCGGTRSVPRKVQRAIRAAGPGDTILVCPGTYTEQLTIKGARDGLTVRAVEPWTAIVRTPRDLGAWPQTLITIDRVDGVVVQWLQLEARTSAPCSWLDRAVWVHAAHDVEIRSVRIQPLGADTVGRCGYGYGIHVSEGASAFVGYNLIRDFAWAGVHIRDLKTTAVVYRNSIQYFHAAEALDPIACCATGIHVFDNRRVNIQRNVIRGGPGPGWPTPILGAGISVTLSDGSVVAHNTVSRAAYGLSTWPSVDPSARAVIRDNIIGGGTPAGAGLLIGDGSMYSGNRVSGYAIGAWAGREGGSGATIRGNDFRGNDRLDCLDDSGVNKWIDNLGDTSEPADICSAGP